jgi:hypothetical protein
VPLRAVGPQGRRLKCLKLKTQRHRTSDLLYKAIWSVEKRISDHEV